MKITVGRIVQYKLSAYDADEINRRRIRDAAHSDTWPKGAQAHTGNTVYENDIFPMIVCRVWDGPQIGVNGQVFLDGNDTFWAASRHEGIDAGTWMWPKMEQ